MPPKGIWDFEAFEVYPGGGPGLAWPKAIAYTRGGDAVYYEINSRSQEEVCSYMLSSFKPATVYYAHGLLPSFLLFVKGLIALKIDFGWFFVGYDLYEVTIKHGGATYILRCSHKLLPFKLDNFYPGLVGKPRKGPQDDEVRVENYERDPFLDRTTPSPFLAKSDCLLLKEGVGSFYRELSGMGITYNRKSLTCGSIALNYYVSRYNHIKLNLPKKVRSIIRQAYYGGRCEVFGNPKKDEKVLHFDFRGMYQSCMLGYLPSGDFKYVNENLDLNRPGFYFVELECNDEIPPLPSREERLVFKCGRISGWFWHEEVMAAMRLCKVEKLRVIHGLLSLDNKKSLEDFVYDLNRVREQGGIKKDIGKLLINSFYGRLGIDEGMEIVRLSKSNEGGESYSKCGDLFLTRHMTRSNPRANTAIAAVITARARVKLLEAFAEVKASGGRLLYCDTDSVFAAFPKALTVENRLLGKHVTFDTSLEDTIIGDSVFITPKTYGLRLANGKEFIKIKGVGVGGLKLDELKAKFYSGTAHIEVPSRTFSTKNLEAIIRYDVKEVKLGGYSKRT
jgi:hypothetical protein